jgi:hypothetical protein
VLAFETKYKYKETLNTNKTGAQKGAKTERRNRGGTGEEQRREQGRNRGGTEEKLGRLIVKKTRPWEPTDQIRRAPKQKHHEKFGTQQRATMKHRHYRRTRTSKASEPEHTTTTTSTATTSRRNVCSTKKPTSWHQRAAFAIIV